MLVRLSGLLLILPGISGLLYGQVQVSYPSERIVIQRNVHNEGTVYVTGTVSQISDRIEARLVVRDEDPGESSTSWITLDNTVANGSFSGMLQAKGGRYDLEVRAIRNNNPVGSPAIVQKVGIGEVFLIVGHSNAQGVSQGVGAQSDLVSSMNLNEIGSVFENYLTTADPQYQPVTYSQLCTACGMAPFHGTPWFWGKFGDKVVEHLKVPVLLYGAAFGGSNMAQTYMAAYGIPFEHGFINSSIGMPYINIENTLNAMVPKTGLRAIISAHGVNDGGSTREEFYFHHKGVIDKTRETEKFRNLVWMIARSCYNNGIQTQLLEAQEDLLLLEHVFPGPDLNSIGNEGRGNDTPDNTDHLHFNSLGQTLAANLWGDAVAAQNFLNSPTVIMPEPPAEPAGSLPVTLATFTARTDETGAVHLHWSTTEEVNNSHFEIQYSFNGGDFFPAGIRDGKNNADGLTLYDFVFNGPFQSDMTYFRLKQVDTDGREDLSSILVVHTPESPLLVYPNPSAGIFEINSHIKNIRVIDFNGITVLESKDSQNVNLSHLPQGNYVFVIQNRRGELLVRTVQKQ